MNKKTVKEVQNNQMVEKDLGSDRVKKSFFPIVAIGASAGGLEAIELFVSHIPAITGMAYVVVTHLDRDHVSIMPELLKKHSKLPVLPIHQGMLIVPDTIYVIPPKLNVILENGLLNLVEQVEPHYKNSPIDYFLKSLAQERMENAAAIILSGCGTDGTIGARDIKLNGGIVIAQEPGSAKFSGMPSSIIHAGMVDFVLTPDKMPAQLIRWLNSSDIKEGKESLELQTIFTLIRFATKYDFSCYKTNTIYRRIEKQMNLHHISTLQEYIKFISENREEIKKLVKGFLIGVTRFFRDLPAFDVFKQEILPLITQDKPVDYCLRVWVPGCSTGEEVYSIAICLAECMTEFKRHFYVQIFGTDIDSDALAIARSGTYSNEIVYDVSEERLNKFFIKENNAYKIKKEIRSMCVFGEQNITCDPPFTRMDLISCRNLLIYFNSRLQKKILPVFHFSLKPGGVLFLGKSESISGYTDLFKLVNRKEKFFQRKDAISSSRTILNFPDKVRRETMTLPFHDQSTMQDIDTGILSLMGNLLLNLYFPECMIVNHKGDVLFSHGDVEKYIHLPAASGYRNIYDIIQPSLRKILISVISTVSTKKRSISYHNLSVEQGDHSFLVDIKVFHLEDNVQISNLVLVVFEKPSSHAIDEKSRHSADGVNEKFIASLENDLRSTKENLQATIEELESSNEELQSTNEELQSTNEEIETSKEELNSLNEELMIMNTELQTRIDQLALVHDDMSNLFNSTDIATVFLDINLCIRRFTPKAQDFIHLIPTDIGRPFEHLATTLKYDQLNVDAREVLRTLNQKHIEVTNADGRWFVVRIIPYRTLANVIDGVVITLQDISEQRQLSNNLNKMNKDLNDVLACARNIFDAIILPVIILTEDFHVSFANRAFYKSFSRLPDDILNKLIDDIDIFREVGLKEFLDKDYFPKKLFEGVSIEKKCHINGFNNIKITLTKIFNYARGSDTFMLTLEPK